MPADRRAVLQARTRARTDDLVDFWKQHSDVPPAQLEQAIPAAIDALYSNRDGNGNMHSAGAEAAVAALEAIRS